MLVAKQRVKLDRPVIEWVHDLFGAPPVVSADITPEIAAHAGLLNQFHGDPADRLIVATAAALSLTLITKDRQMHEFAEQSGLLTTIW
jgi:PIN domain nuclease of toxin-antitoxin system